MTYTEFTFIAFMIFRNFLHHKRQAAPRIGAGKVSNTKVSSSSSHEIMVEDAAGLDYIDKVAKRAVEIIFHAE